MWIRASAAAQQLSLNESAIESLNDDLVDVIPMIKTITSDTTLQGKGFNAIRQRFSSCDLLLAEGMSELCYLLGVLYNNQDIYVTAQFGQMDLVDEDTIIAQINSLKQQRDSVEIGLGSYTLDSGIPGAFASNGNLSAAITLLEERLAKLHEYNALTSTLYDGAVDLVITLQQGMQYAKSLAYDPQAGSFASTTGLSNSWATTLQTQIDTIRAAKVYGVGGQFGGNQSGPHSLLLSSNQAAIQDMIDIINGYPAYQNMDQAQLETFLEGLSSEGCGYTAMCNAIFERYEGREQEFQQTFGFPMYRQDAGGNRIMNHEYLLVDMYCAYDDPNPFNPGVSTDARERIFEGYMRDHGVKVNVIQGIETDSGTIAGYSGKNTILMSFRDGTSLVPTDSSNSSYELGFNVGHAVIVTDVEGDQIIVSSWGNEYVLDNINSAQVSIIDWGD